MRPSLYCVSEDRSLRMATGAIASRRGAQFRVFATPEEFLAHYALRADEAPAGCLVAEGDMLARRDAAFAVALRKQADLPVVVIAGTADPRATLVALGPGGWAVLDGPAAPAALDAAVTRALAYDRWRRDDVASAAGRALGARLRDDLRRASAVELTAQLVHELSQPLTAINAWAAMCQANVKTAGAAAEALERPVELLVRESRRATDVLRAFRALARRREPEIAPCDLNAALTAVAALVEEQARTHGIDLRLVLAPHLPAADADPTFLELAGYILCCNAIDALAERPGGRREIVMRSFAAGGEVCASVADSGPGLDESALDRLFKPVASSRPNHLGIGLAVCRTALESLGGRLRLENNTADGACFSFAVPAAGR